MKNSKIIIKVSWRKILVEKNENESSNVMLLILNLRYFNLLESGNLYLILKIFLQMKFFQAVWSILEGPLSSTLPSVQHKKPTLFKPPKSLSSTPKPPQFNTSLSSKPKIPQFKVFLFWTERCVELRDYWCWTEGL